MKINPLLKKKLALFYFLAEIRYRCLYGLLCLVISFFTAYCNSFDLIYLFVRPFFAPKNFIFTDITEALSITVKICIMFSFFLGSAFLFYQFWCFLAPSLLANEKQKIRFYFFLSYFLFFFGFLIIYFFLLPEIFKFLFSFELKNQLLTIQLEARIFSYVEFTFYTYIFFIFFFQLPLFFLVLFHFKVLTPYKLAKFRKYFLYCFLILASFISPPDALSQLCLVLFFLTLYELSIFLGFLSEKIEKNKRITDVSSSKMNYGQSRLSSPLKKNN